MNLIQAYKASSNQWLDMQVTKFIAHNIINIQYYILSRLICGHSRIIKALTKGHWQLLFGCIGQKHIHTRPQKPVSLPTGVREQECSMDPNDR